MLQKYYKELHMIKNVLKKLCSKAGAKELKISNTVDRGLSHITFLFGTRVPQITWIK
jgi:hypothetical protein